ncbi:hypothetical protein [Caballeronia sp. dw_19]|uniref:hypothetical protein n=1 Tax=Caballeronia sp. dw_19 TaxID=2719791 RepID=UPI001BCE4D21|nr:hypothetical protein [Caballeronia sp. dw_19]
MDNLVDDELAHIEAILGTWLPEIETNPVLTSNYWRERIFLLMGLNHLSPSQLQRAHAVLAILDRFDQTCAFAQAGNDSRFV